MKHVPGSYPLTDDQQQIYVDKGHGVYRAVGDHQPPPGKPDGMPFGRGRPAPSIKSKRRPT